ncbi:hypothetical protein F5882DRAFT_472189 [Hyaloscypha sp. PMI_1271]|nr:hypothetical protein F5882DRAFT_472189 [Hyaloscypha sp. PMI_1271]
MSPVIQFKHAFRNVSRGLSAIFCLAYTTTPNLNDNANLDIDTTSGLLDSRFIIGIKGFCVLLFSLSTYLHDVGFDHAWGVGFLATFCVSSGYVLSIQPLLYIQAGAWDKLLDTLTSYSFRRYLRLMVPSFAMVLFAFSMLWLGFYNFPRPKRFTPSLHLTANDGNHGFHDLWQKTTYSLLWPFVWTFEPTPLVRPLWSINVMYRNSMFLVCVLIAISRCRLRIRQGLIIAFMIISWRHEQMELFSALGGMLLAQLHEQGSSRESTPCPSLDLEKVPPTFMSFEKGSRVSTGRASLPFITQCIYFTTCGIGICLCIGNDLLTSRPRWDNRARPFQHVGAILLVWAAGMSSFIRRLLLNRRAQYFGQRSFAIYITHDIVFRVIGQRVAATIIGESEDVILYALGTVLGLCVSIPFLILLAHAVHVYINDATIAATKSLEAICVNKNCLVIYATVSEACDTQTIKVTSSLTDAISGKLEVFGSTENSRYIHGVIDSPTSKAVAAIIWFLLPSFVSKRLRPGVIALPPKLHPTAWLDGLRGIASYSVYSCHLMYYFPNVGVPWGLDGTNKNFFQLPIVNLPSRGSTMVTIFFMISGYVLSFGALKQIRTGGPRQKLSKTISSAIFRRGPRLYLPPMAITFCTAFLAQLGLFESPYSIAKDPVGSLSGSGTLVKRERHLEQLTSFWTEFLRWINSSENMTDPFT